jgi:alpha-mannosidase
VHHNRAILENRITRVWAEWLLPARDAARFPLATSALTLPGEPVPYEEVAARLDEFRPIAPGTPWGRPWSTTWLRVCDDLPHGAADGLPEDAEVTVELGFSGAMAGFQAEGTVYRDGRIVCGLHPRRRAVALHRVAGGAGVDLLVEAAANPDVASSFRPTPLGSPATAGDAPLYTFGGAFVVVPDPEVRALVSEVQSADQLMRSLPEAGGRRSQVELAFRRALDALDRDDVAGTAAAARRELAAAFAPANGGAAHHVHAIGHAHLDTAWLWPLRETRRKAARTFANATTLMEDFPDYRFAASQAQHYEWVRTDHPELFERIRALAAEGRWVPVGGMWVEADMNLPSGESIARQLVHGQRFFEQHFGRRCEEVWIPDVFGYPGNLPQVFLAGGCGRFVTQKLSWNTTNRFPHHTFTWEGHDGSSVLAHFPPVETYNAEVSARDLAHAATTFRDHAWSRHSLMPFGHGNGGGGPTREMMQRARLLADVDPLPTVTVDSPSAFFDAVEAEVAAGAPVPRWRGELYFEMHRGTLTSQARTKALNRRCEHLLAEAELWLATLGDGSRAAELDTLWKRVLTQQFHDILPGSSIAWVHEDAERELAGVAEACEAVVADALGRLAGPVPMLANPSAHARDEVVASPVDPAGDGPRQRLADGRVAFRASVPGFGLAEAVALDVDDAAEVTEAGAGGSAIRLANAAVAVTLVDGDVTSVVDRARRRELLAPGEVGARLTLAPDHPVEFDAWDLEQWTASLAVPLGPADSLEVVDAGPLVASVRVRRPIGGGGVSWVEQTFTLRAGSPRLEVALEVEWQESEKLLAIEFPLDVRADEAACEMQFGLTRRPTHANTTWDDARYEVCAHRFVDLSEPSFGVAVLNDGRHGHAVQTRTGDLDGRAGTCIRVSLLRAPRYPDPAADRGRHAVTLALVPHGPSLAGVPAEADALNRALRVVPGGSAGAPPAPVVALDAPGVGVSAVKLADDGSGDLVVRLWEALGDRAQVRMRATVPGRGWPVAALRCNLLEEPLPFAPDPTVSDGEVAVELRPFELITLRLR